MDASQLMLELERLIEAGDEAATKKFIMDNFSSFPQETQAALAADMLESALDDRLTAIETIQNAKEDAAEMVRDIEESQV